MDRNFPNHAFEQELGGPINQVRLAPDNSENVIYFYDIEAEKFDYMNKAIENLTGYTMNELNDIGLKSIVVEEIKTPGKTGEAFTDATSGFSVEDISSKCLIRCKNGELKWIENISFARTNSSGSKTNSIGVFKNVTPIHKLFEQLQEEKNKVEAILDIAEVVFIIIDES
jgi:PAS domain S-box-containing protein